MDGATVGPSSYFRTKSNQKASKLIRIGRSLAGLKYQFFLLALWRKGDDSCCWIGLYRLLRGRKRDSQHRPAHPLRVAPLFRAYGRVSTLPGCDRTTFCGGATFAEHGSNLLGRSLVYRTAMLSVIDDLDPVSHGPATHLMGDVHNIPVDGIPHHQPAESFLGRSICLVPTGARVGHPPARSLDI